MTKEELEELLNDCPSLYHMAERDSWPSIKVHGLLSTTALLDLYGVSGEKRAAIECCRRPKSVVLEEQGLCRAVVRDQIPMDDKGLTRCLEDGLTPTDWYRLLNSKVFFWLTRKRLLRLLNAGTYRSQVHDVLEVEARSLVNAYKNSIWLCPMNSGCTKPIPHPRGEKTFQRVEDYPYTFWKREKRRTRGERVVELAIDYAVPDVAKFVTRVSRMQGSTELNVIFEK